MKEIVTELGLMLIDMLPAVIIIGLFIGMLAAGGVAGEAVKSFMTGLTG